MEGEVRPSRWPLRSFDFDSEMEETLWNYIKHHFHNKDHGIQSKDYESLSNICKVTLLQATQHEDDECLLEEIFGLGFNRNVKVAKDDYKDKTVLVIDDVSNSGKTLIYAIKHFLNQPIKTLKTLVLVDRSHNRYPVRVDFSGLTISTTLKEHIEVSLDSNDKGVYLM